MKRGFHWRRWWRILLGDMAWREEKVGKSGLVELVGKGRSSRDCGFDGESKALSQTPTLTSHLRNLFRALTFRS